MPQENDPSEIVAMTCGHCGEAYNPGTAKSGDLYGYCPAPWCQRNGRAYETAEANHAREDDHQPMDERD
jgi:hypothetical protein